MYSYLSVYFACMEIPVATGRLNHMVTMAETIAHRRTIIVKYCARFDESTRAHGIS